MNITIFGASGEIGRFLTNNALINGDAVTVCVRRSESFVQTENNLTIVTGDLTNQTLIENAIQNADVVISMLAPSIDFQVSKGTPIAFAHFLIINAMKKNNKKRFIILATPTVVPVALAKTLFPNTYLEMKKIEALVKRSSLDWTIVQIINPNVKPKNNKYCASLDEKSEASCEKISAFIYSAALKNLYVNEMPIVFK